MLERYGYTHKERKRAAIAAAFGRKPIEAQSEERESTTETLSAQNPPQFEVEAVVAVM